MPAGRRSGSAQQALQLSGPPAQSGVIRLASNDPLARHAGKNNADLG
jgi:hypothetical protein